LVAVYSQLIPSKVTYAVSEATVAVPAVSLKLTLGLFSRAAETPLLQLRLPPGGLMELALMVVGVSVAVPLVQVHVLPRALTEPLTVVLLWALAALDAATMPAPAKAAMQA
jgi:hypothetical protein